MLKNFAEKHVILFDGAMGTVIQSLGLDVPSVNEMLNITQPEAIVNIHSRYFDAGANVAVTNTFGANRIVLAEYGLEDRVTEITTAAVQNARAAVREALRTDGSANKFVALSVGPGSRLPSLGQISYDELKAAYIEQIAAGARAGIDLVMIETCQDLLQIKAALGAVMAVNEMLDANIPASVSFTVEENAALLVGTDIATVATVLSGYDIFSLGINCGFGPDRMAHPLAELAKYWGGRLYLSSNAGMPIMKDGKLSYPMNAEDFAQRSKELQELHKLAMVGGCCGTSFEHIKALRSLLGNVAPIDRRAEVANKGFAASTYNLTSLYQEPAPTLIGERANATGSKAFRELLKADNFDAMANIARGQQSASHVIDLSVAYSGRNEMEDMLRTVSILNRELTAPIMIDSTSAEVIEAALKLISGKAVINSINFEDGGAKLHRILSMLKLFPAAVVALTIDEDGMAQTKDDKLRIAHRICKVWIDEYGLPAEDLLIDFLTFAVTSGDEESKLAAVHTVEAIREFKKEYPHVGTVLGVSNVSFGLSAAARTVLNAVFLDKCVKAGLDAAIVHAEKLIPLSSLSDEDIRLSEELLDGADGALDRFIAHFDGVAEAVTEEQSLPPEQELRNKVIRGDSADIAELVNTVLKEHKATDILNNILLPAMQEVGTLFNGGKLLLPFVLKSAEVMKECSKVLAPFLQEGSKQDRGKIVLATVKGDVHDIGKNLVDVILSGNGYSVINLGTKVAGEDIIRAVQEHKPDAVGMSGLLVKSVELMKENIELLKANGLEPKVLLGGAALSEAYVRDECASIIPGKVYYCKDAFAGVAAMEATQPATNTAPRSDKSPFEGKKWAVSPFKGNVDAAFIGKSPTISFKFADVAARLPKRHQNDEMLRNIEAIAECKGLYGFYPVEVRGDSLYVNDQLFAKFPTGANGECFTELYQSTGSSILPIQVVSIGDGLQDYIGRFYSDDKYSDYYKYHRLLAELTDALAAIMQQELNKSLMLNGKTLEKTLRYSFGYPLCPDLAGNKALCDLLNAADIGVSVNENYQMEPVYSTCAMISWHPSSKY